MFSVVGKLQGPLEADPAKGDLGVVALGNTLAEQTILLKNTGVAPLTITSSSVTGTDAATSPPVRRPVTAPPSAPGGTAP